VVPPPAQTDSISTIQTATVATLSLLLIHSVQREPVLMVFKISESDEWTATDLVLHAILIPAQTDSISMIQTVTVQMMISTMIRSVRQIHVVMVRYKYERSVESLD